jgi:hypothetical protein
MKRFTFYFLKGATAFCALVGVIISLIVTRQDGYSHWSKRLLYFTFQSNVWIGITMLAVIINSLRHTPKALRFRETLYRFKYVFTVAITVTFLVFSLLLAPFADESYNLFSLNSYLTHVFSPAFAVADFFTDDYPLRLSKKHVLATIIPPLSYYGVTMLLSALRVDFGRGDNFPYLFIDFYSPAGLFGFTLSPVPSMGAVYWVIAFTALIWSIAFLYARLQPFAVKARRAQKNKALDFA